MNIADENGPPQEYVEELRDRYLDAHKVLTDLREVLISMSLERGVSDEDLKAQMAKMFQDFGKSLESNSVDPIVAHVVIFSLAVASLEKWTP